MSEEYGNDLVTVVDEDGKQHQFEVVDAIETVFFTFLLSTDICKASSDSHFAFLYFFFFGMVLIPVSCTIS